MNARIAITGANGFVGRALARTLLAQGRPVTGIVRGAAVCEPGVDTRSIESLDSISPEAFAQAEAVIHLAARVHVMRDAEVDPLAAFRTTNVDGTLRAAESAARAGATRFVYVSSIKALAELDNGRPLKETDERRPPDPYGISKAEAEVKLMELGARTGLEIVIVRPPLVYGPEVRANFLSLMSAIAKGVPLPIGAVEARRSLCYVDNLASALIECATHARAAGQVFHVTDGEDPSVAELARLLGRHLGRAARLLPVPVGVLKLAGRVTGKSAQIDRLTGSLRVNSTHIRDMLGWRPPVSLDAGLAATAAWFRATQRPAPANLR
ncbi:MULTISPECIES: SDR family oxidoreductase [unclassified Caballeronia]|uniref:UDP-glucose 4-epimerase family protein n=1 Tax=unclassified Caballeronia TaxID=2646786 RepID=UPI00286297D3|nr:MULTISPECIES: SDR family oxidoreductase [unclassified Caballeronia]MDR5751438.1 SDR family oxidoreductase [Caballeronia sp. LZ024]MDR5844421.1 SDR family oxidoreductase [Caballeronia sp. LZ031]